MEFQQKIKEGRDFPKGESLALSQNKRGRDLHGEAPRGMVSPEPGNVVAFKE